MTGKATEAMMDALHGLMAAGMSDELARALERAQKPKLIADDEGKLTVPNPEYEPLSPKLLGVIRAFLKDNGIDAPASSPRFNALTEQLRNMNVDDEDHLPN